MQEFALPDTFLARYTVEGDDKTYTLRIFGGEKITRTLDRIVERKGPLTSCVLTLELDLPIGAYLTQRED